MQWAWRAERYTLSMEPFRLTPQSIAFLWVMAAVVVVVASRRRSVDRVRHGSAAGDRRGAHQGDAARTPVVAVDRG